MKFVTTIVLCRLVFCPQCFPEIYSAPIQVKWLFSIGTLCDGYES